jgi:outer membrane protein, multidrug efflux system
VNLSVGLLNTKRVKHLLARAVACGMLLVLPSCGIPCLRVAEPGPPLPATFKGATSPDNSSQLWIDEFFHDPVLTHLIEQALAGNRELKILNEDIEIAAAQILARQGAFLPLVTFGANVGVEKHSLYTPLGAAEKVLEYAPGKHFPDPVPDFRFGLNLFAPLDIWREYRNARDAAVQRYFATCERRNYFVTRLVAEIAENYYRLMALDKRLETLENTIELFQLSLQFAQARLKAARGTELAVRRFQAEVRRNQSEMLIVQQDIVEVENRINFLVNRFPQPVERNSAGFFDLTIHPLSVGVPPQLLQNRPDIRQAERELEAAGLDVKVARAHFFPRVDITGSVGYEAFSPKYLFNTPEALFYSLAGELVAPLINKAAIRAEYKTANAKQLQAVYDYQRVILNAFTEVVNRLSMVQNYSRSIEIKRQQLQALQASVEVANKLFQAARAEYVEVLLAQRDLMEARMVLIGTKQQQLSAIVNTYQALGGGDPAKFPGKLEPCALVNASPPLPSGDKDKAPEKEDKDKASAKDKDEVPQKDKDKAPEKDKAPAKDKDK